MLGFTMEVFLPAPELHWEERVHPSLLFVLYKKAFCLESCTFPERRTLEKDLA